MTYCAVTQMAECLPVKQNVEGSSPSRAATFLDEYRLHPNLAQLFFPEEGWTPPSRGTVTIDAELVEGFVKTFLHESFDRPAPIESFHKVMWALCCNSAWSRVAIAAPRGHSKSTAITLSFVLVSLLFRARDFVLLISNTEAQAAAFLFDIAGVLAESDLIRTAFKIKRFLKENQTELIVEFQDGEQFCVVAKGAEQKVRGLKWRSKRPNMIVCDDLENDEAVRSQDRREALMKWFLNALIPCGSDDCIIRVVGTVLHSSALLTTLLDDKSWARLRLQAHAKGFYQILWPDKFPKARLMDIRQTYINQGNPDGYANEYLNMPVDTSTGYFRSKDLVPLPPGWQTKTLTYYAAADLAVSVKQRADYSVIVVAGVDNEGYIYVVDCYRERMDAKEMIDLLLDVQKRYKPDLFALETGVIEKAIGPFLEERMRKTGTYISLHPITTSVDKVTRGRSWQARVRAGTVMYDTEAEWWPDVHNEMMWFPRGRNDDTVDAQSLIGLMLDEISSPMSDSDRDADDYRIMRQRHGRLGRNRTTGY